MPDLDAIRARLKIVTAVVSLPPDAEDSPLIDALRHYKRDVAALLAALDAKEQKETGETCFDCPPSGYPTDKTRCDECPRRAQGEDDRG